MGDNHKETLKPVFFSEFGPSVSLDINFLSKDKIPCILCNENFEPECVFQPKLLLKHLLDDHKFVIGSPEQIADLRHYILYWRRKLLFSELENHCIVYNTNSNPDQNELSEKYYLLCDKLPEDKELRIKLKHLKLNFITQQKEEECRKKDFSYQCVYCSLMISGGVADCFYHLSMDHGFSLGNPDNIVFGERLLEMINLMLKKFQCLYCEKIFKNHTVLREHMRKKQHKSLNPKNKKFDQFYVLNYLQPGLPWEEAKKSMLEEEREMHLPLNKNEFKDGEDLLDEDQMWTDWTEETGSIPTVCLFCPFTMSNIPLLFTHIKTEHRFDFQALTEECNFYSKVKIINFIRTRVKIGQCIRCNESFSSNDELLSHISSCSLSLFTEDHLWDDPLYMIPVLENDGLLIHLEDNDIDDEDTSSVASSVHDEVVLPEETVSLPPSILNDWRLRVDLSAESGEECRSPPSLFKCLFCPFAMTGDRGRGACLQHMNELHDFNLRKALHGVDPQHRANIVNYLRKMTELGKCFVCGKAYMTRVALEEHRLLEGHTYFEQSVISIILQDNRWSKCESVYDGFIEMEKTVAR